MRFETDTEILDAPQAFVLIIQLTIRSGCPSLFLDC